MNMHIRLLAASLLLAAGAPAVAADTVEAPQITREGEGPRRAALNKRERTPFPADAWTKLSDWTNGPALSPTAAEGKVVLIVTWTDYLPTARRAVAAATRLADRHAKDGLIVVMVHDAKEWASASKPKSTVDAAALLVAHDASGEFRKALDVDQDPDFYLIDRAGQLRFADITSEAIEGAVTMLLAEKADAAAGVNDRIKQANEDARRAAQRAAAANARADMVQIPVLPFPKPSEADYNKVKWPDRPRDENVRDDPKAMVTLGEVKLPETGWFPRKPSLDGKVVFAYTWHPGVDISYTELADFIDTMQRQYARDVVFVGVVTMYENLNGITLTKDDKDPEKVKERVAKFLEIRNYDHYIALGLDADIHSAALSTAGGSSGSSLVPGIVILSSDGKARYATFPREKRNIFYRAALDAIVAADPGVKARRKVEDEWLKAQKENGGGE